MTRMRDLEVGPADPSPTAVPDTLSVIQGGPDPDGSGRGVRAPAWLAAAAGRIPGVRMLRRRPVTPLTAATVSAAVAALLAGGAVAVYQQRPVEVVPQAPVQTRAILEPESWLVIEEAPWAPPVRDDQAYRQLRDQAMAQHPSEATVALVLTHDWPPDLVGLPPGTYQVRASCTVSDPPDDLAGPIVFSVDVHEPAYVWVEDQEGEDFRCDGAVHPTAAGLVVTDYQAFTVAASVWVELPEELRGLEEEEWYPYDSAVVVVSVTEA